VLEGQELPRKFRIELVNFGKLLRRQSNEIPNRRNHHTFDSLVYYGQTRFKATYFLI